MAVYSSGVAVKGVAVIEIFVVSSEFIKVRSVVLAEIVTLSEFAPYVTVTKLVGVAPTEY